MVATGVKPRLPDIPGIELPLVAGYSEVITGHVECGDNVLVIGAGGIGFDVATFLLGHELEDPEKWLAYWGIDSSLASRGALASPSRLPAKRRISLLQRKETPPGKGLGKTTGWAHRLHLTNHGVQMLPGVEYLAIEDNGLWIKQNGEDRLLAADNIVICAGQIEENQLYRTLRAENSGAPVHLIGGAERAAELDAQRAIYQGAELGSRL